MDIRMGGVGGHGRTYGWSWGTWTYVWVELGDMDVRMGGVGGHGRTYGWSWGTWMYVQVAAFRPAFLQGVAYHPNSAVAGETKLSILTRELHKPVFTEHKM